MNFPLHQEKVANQQIYKERLTALHPDGRFGIHHKQKVRLTEQQYFCKRILHKDQRFSKSPGYIFAAAAYNKQKQLASKAIISFMRGRKSQSTDGTKQYQLDDAFTTFDGISTGKKLNMT